MAVKKKEKTIILVDYRWVLYRSAFRFSDFQIEEDGVQYKTGCIYGVLELVKLILDHYDNCKIIFCLDGKPVYREGLLPDYKRKRHEADPKDEILAAKALHDEPIKILSSIPEVSFIRDAEREADDLMAIMAFREMGKGNKAVIFTADKDLLQLMQFGVQIANQVEEGKLQLLNPNYITAHPDFQVAPEELLYLRALDGDKSDGIPAALGGNKELKRAFAIQWAKTKDKYLENFDQLLESMEPTIEEIFKGKKAQANNRERLKTIKDDAIRNMKLMELDLYYPVYEAYKAYKETQNKDLLDNIKGEFKFKDIKIIDLETPEEEVVELLTRYDLQRHKAWMNYNNYI